MSTGAVQPPADSRQKPSQSKGPGRRSASSGEPNRPLATRLPRVVAASRTVPPRPGQLQLSPVPTLALSCTAQGSSGFPDWVLAGAQSRE